MWLLLVLMSVIIIIIIIPTSVSISPPPPVPCSRWPGKECQGPFTIRPSHRAGARSSCTPVWSSDMIECMRQCQQEPCCRAFGLSGDGTCETTPILTEEYDFVKEIPPNLEQACLTAVDVEPCTITIGAAGGQAFDVRDTFEAADADIVRIDIGVGRNAFEVLNNAVSRLVFVFRNGAEADVGYAAAELTDKCKLESGEYVTSVTTYSRMDNGIRTALSFRTTRKVCGPYGDNYPAAHVASGNKLKYVSGMAGLMFDQLSFAFDGGCEETVLPSDSGILGF